VADPGHDTFETVGEGEEKPADDGVDAAVKMAG